MSENGEKVSDFARRLGESPQTVARYALPPGSRRRRIPREAAMAKIYAATAGAVTPNDFYDLPDLGEAAAGNGAGGPARRRVAPTELIRTEPDPC